MRSPLAMAQSQGVCYTIYLRKCIAIWDGQEVRVMHAAARRRINAGSYWRARIGRYKQRVPLTRPLGDCHRKGLDRLVLIRAFGAHGQQATYHAVAMARGDSDPGVC